MVWNPDPNLLEWGPLRVRWYGLCFMTGFLLGYALMRRVFRKEGKPEHDLDVLLLYMMAGTMIGARLGHVLFYYPEYYFTHPLDIPKIWEGGLASHGGVLGILAALWLYTRRRPGQPYLWLLCRMAIPAALGAGFIRIGNFFNSEILGTPAEVPWAVVFARVDAVPRHPAQLYESASYFLVFLGLAGVYRRLGPKLPRGLLLGLMLVGIFGARFVIEFVKQQQAPFADGWLLSMGQLLSVPFVLAGVALLVRAGYSRPDPASHSPR